jgi:hypothetical protein
MRIHDLRFLAVLACGFAGDAIAQEATDMKLTDAGFVMRPASTPEQLDRLKRLPARKWVVRSKAGGRYFLYADPDYCRCVFLGNQRAMQAYRDMVSSSPGVPVIPVPPSGMSAERELVEDMNDDLSTSISEGDILDLN